MAHFLPQYAVINHEPQLVNLKKDESIHFIKRKKKKTLLVDDDVFVRDSLNNVSATNVCFMRTEEFAEAGLHALNEENFDINISDFWLPGTDGLKFLKMAGITHPQAVKFLITAYRDDLIFTEAIRVVVHEFIE